MEQINQFQTVAIDHYCEGEFKDHPQEGETGDGLFDFIMIELSDKEDCETVEDAVGRLNTAIDQLQAVKDAMEDLL